MKKLQKRLKFAALSVAAIFGVLALLYCWLAFWPTGAGDVDSLRAQLEVFRAERVKAVERLMAPTQQDRNAAIFLPASANAVSGDRPTTVPRDIMMAIYAFHNFSERIVLGETTLPATAVFKERGVPLDSFLPASDRVEDLMPQIIGRFLAARRWANPAPDLAPLRTVEGGRFLHGQLDEAESAIVSGKSLPPIKGDWNAGFYSNLAAWRAALRGNPSDADRLKNEWIQSGMNASLKVSHPSSRWFSQTMLGIDYYVIDAVQTRTIADSSLAKIDALVSTLNPSIDEQRAARALEAHNRIAWTLRNLDDSGIRFDAIRDSGINFLLGQKFEPMARKLVLPILKEELDDWISAIADGNAQRAESLRVKILSQTSWLEISGVDSRSLESELSYSIDPNPAGAWPNQPNKNQLAADYARGLDKPSSGEIPLRLTRLTIAAGRFHLANDRWPKDLAELQAFGLIPWLESSYDGRFEILHLVPSTGSLKLARRIDVFSKSMPKFFIEFSKARDLFAQNHNIFAPLTPEALGPYLPEGVKPADIADCFDDFPATSFPPATVIVWIDRKVDLRQLLGYLPEGSDATESQLEWLRANDAGWRVMFVAVLDDPHNDPPLAEAEEILKSAP